MSFITARIIFIIAGIVWTISILLPYSRLGVTERYSRTIKIVMAAVFFGAFITYAVVTT